MWVSYIHCQATAMFSEILRRIPQSLLQRTVSVLYLSCRDIARGNIRHLPEALREHHKETCKATQRPGRYLTSEPAECETGISKISFGNITKIRNLEIT